MQNIAKVLIGLAALAFVLAAIGAVFDVTVLRVNPEGFSRASNNLALVGIGVALCFKD
jgi:hypothetical protein